MLTRLRISLIMKKIAQEEMLMQRDYSKMTEEEALEILRRDWPEYNRSTDQELKEGGSMVKWLSILESFA